MADKAIQPAIHDEQVKRALAQVAAEGSKLLNGNLDAREELISSARNLISVSETPAEALLWNIWALPTRGVAARIAVDLKIFETAVQDNGRFKSNSELAAPAGASPALVKRITRACASMGMLEEDSSGLYGPNDLTRLLVQPEFAAGIIFCWDGGSASFAHMPAYLRNNQFANPENPVDGPFQYGNNHTGHAFGLLASRPEIFQAFHKYLFTLRKHRPSWFEMYPVEEKLIKGLKDGDASALVDVGGGTGQILQDFQAKVPGYAGKLVLQELPEVIEAAKGELGDNPSIELQVHDFFAPQPVKGARAYFMRSVMHDWADDQCRTILDHLKDAMEPGYSRILINDCVVADDHAAWQHVSLDLFMMALASAQERTESEWRALIKSCGLEIAGIYNKGQGNEGLIEVVLPESTA